MTLVTGIIELTALLFLIATLVYLVDFLREGRSYRATMVAMRTVRVLDPQTRIRLTGLVEQGSKTQAIKDLREATGLRLKEAEEVVRYLAQGFQPQRRIIPARTEERARELFAQGHGIKAIKLIRRRRWRRSWRGP